MYLLLIDLDDSGTYDPLNSATLCYSFNVQSERLNKVNYNTIIIFIAIGHGESENMLKIIFIALGPV